MSYSLKLENKYVKYQRKRILVEIRKRAKCALTAHLSKRKE